MAEEEIRYTHAIIIPPEVKDGPTAELVQYVIESATMKLRRATVEEMQRLKKEEATHHTNIARCTASGDHVGAEREATYAREAHLKHDGAELVLAQLRTMTNWVRFDTAMVMKRRD